MKWRTFDGRVLFLSQLGDSHLLNIIRHIHLAPQGWYKDPDNLLHELYLEAEKRDLKVEDLEAADGTFIDKDGKKKLFSFKDRKYINENN